MKCRVWVLSGAMSMAMTAGVSLTQLEAQVATSPTFNKDIAPIVFNNCVSCHRPNQIAPMSLMSYQEVRPWARAIKNKVSKREMPPWFADPRFGEFSNDPRLTDEQINPHYSRVTELLVVQAFSSVMTQMDAGVMTIEAMRRPGG